VVGHLVPAAVVVEGRDAGGPAGELDPGLVLVGAGALPPALAQSPEHGLGADPSLAGAGGQAGGVGRALGGDEPDDLVLAEGAQAVGLAVEADHVVAVAAPAAHVDQAGRAGAAGRIEEADGSAGPRLDRPGLAPFPGLAV